jgi:hypothetical protein
MKRFRELEVTDANLARLREKSARLIAEIAALEETREVQALEMLKEAGVARLPLAVLEKLAAEAREAGERQASVSCADDAGERVETFVRLTANASMANRKALREAGLCWNGKAGGWTGRVTGAALAGLSERFGDRVGAPVPSHSGAAPAGAGPAPSTAVEAMEAPPVVAAEPSPVAGPQAPGEGNSSPAWVPPSRLPLRRPVTS